MKKAKLTRSLMMAVSVVALSAVMYGCVHSGDDAPADPPAPPPPMDSDGDGVPDDDDDFPNDASETMDSDGDGVGDNAQEAMELADAKAAAMAAWEAARDALASIAGDEAEDPVAYQRAMNALTDAKAAYDAAEAATTSADAEMYRNNAEAARDTAIMQVAAVVYSRDMEAIGVARGAAAQAAQAAKQSYEAAKLALAAVEDFKALDMASYDKAMAQVTAAKTAYEAAMAASNLAADAMLLGDAVAQRDAAQTAKGNADTANTNAMKYADMVQDAEDNALADARTKANEAYEAAKTAAGDARQAADDASDEADAAEAANDGSPAAMDSRTAADEAAEAATMAETARDAAGTAKMAADDAATSAAARGHQQTAEEEQGNAEGHLGTARMKLADAEAAKITAQNTGAGTILLWQQRAVDANDDAQGYAKAARKAADDADAQADAAEADAARAMRARTDYANANAKAMAARNAADAAETAAKAAEEAAADTQAAVDAATAEGVTVAVARDLSNIARAAAMGASGEPAKANTGYMDAMEAASDAMRYAGMHVIGLLIHANGQDILVGTEDEVTDIPTSVANARKARVTAITDLVEAAAIAADNGDSDTTATVSWAPNVEDDPETEDEDETVINMLTMALDPGGDGAVEFLRMDRAADPDASPAVLAHVKTVDRLKPDLSGFEHGYSVTDDGTHVIVFTDKEQETSLVDAKTIENPIANQPVSISRISYIEDAATITDLASLNTNARYDHDGSASTLPLAGTFTCVGPGTPVCALTVNADGQLTGVVGDGTLVFHSAPDTDGDNDGAPDNGQGILTAVVPADAQMDYLVFGVWLQEDGDATDGAQPEFGAFAAGGTTAVAAVEITGTATYNGSATGVYTAGESVDYFQGDATLTAKFGAPGTATDPEAADDEAGTITGMIDNIVAGGVAMSDVIRLNDDGTPADGNITNADGTFSGDARMGAAMTVDAVATYTYNGTWSGQFYNGTADDTTTTDVNESHVAPGSVAGTFGVTGTDDMGTADDMTDDVTRSYVGAFGAHKDD